MEEMVLQTQWGWPIAVYLFLGGLAAGTMLVSGLIALKYEGSFPKTICLSAWAAVFCIALGLVMLLADVTMPMRAMMLWQSFSNFGSWMTIGAWLLFFGIMLVGVWAILATIAWKKEKTIPAIKQLSWPVMVFGVGIAAYTGILLSVLVAHPLWNNVLLPVLFTVSAFDTGIALVLLIMRGEKAAEDKAALVHKLEKWTVILVLTEVVVLTALLLMVGLDGETGTKSVGILLTGQLAVWFWIVFVLCGLVAPGAMAYLAIKPAKAPKATEGDETPVAAESGEAAEKTSGLQPLGNVLCLVGGCALRFLILLAGIPVWM